MTPHGHHQPMTRSQEYVIEHLTAPLSESVADNLVVVFLQHKGRSLGGRHPAACTG